jgi:hypothetical protein
MSKKNRKYPSGKAWKNKLLHVRFLKCNSSFLLVCAHKFDESQSMTEFAKHTK